MIGLVQGGAGVIVGGMALNLLGWIPTVLITGVVVYGLYRLLFKGKGDTEAE